MTIPEPITAAPSKEELDLRIANLRSTMAEKGLDVYVAAHTDNVYYLTNFAYLPFERPFFLVIPAAGTPALVVPLLEVSHARQRVLIDVEYCPYYEYPAPAGRGYVDTLKTVVGDSLKVGVESSLSIAHQGIMPGEPVVADLIDEARLVKTDYEVGRITYAAGVTQVGMKKALEQCTPDAALATIYSESAREMMVKVLFEVPNPNLLVTKFLAAVWPEALSAQPHSVPGMFDTLKKGGPNVAIVTAQANGYSAELERTFFIGQVPEGAKRMFDLFMEARRKAYALVKPGIRAADVDHAVLQVIKDAGHADNILHRTGHGFGITGHEPPWVALGSGHVLEKNMVISIEPGIYMAEVGGFRHSDTVLVTDDGCVSLTDYPDKLEDLVL